MTDDEQIKAHFRAQDEQAPDFETMFKRAHAGTAHTSRLRQHAWPGLAAAALLLLVLGLQVFRQAPEPMPSGDDPMMRQLFASSHWRAPSDTLLKMSPTMNIWGVPTLPDVAPRPAEENQP